MIDIEGAKGAEEEAVRATLEALALVDDEAVPPCNLLEDVDVLLERLVRRHDDVWRSNVSDGETGAK